MNLKISGKIWLMDGKSFWFGFAGGILTLLLLAVVGVGTVWSRGVTVQLDSEEMALLIQKEVVAQAKQQLPKVVDGAKAEVPRIVQEEMQDQISDRMEIAGYVFRMPEELMEQLEINL